MTDLQEYYQAEERQRQTVERINDSCLEAILSMERLEEENAKLLKLVRNLHACNGSCPRCIELMGKCEYEEQLAECGIEAGE